MNVLTVLGDRKKNGRWVGKGPDGIEQPVYTGRQEIIVPKFPKAD